VRENRRLCNRERVLKEEAEASKSCLTRLEKEVTSLKKPLNCKNSEIASLQTHLRVEVLKRTAAKRRNRCDIEIDVNEDILKVKLP